MAEQKQAITDTSNKPLRSRPSYYEKFKDEELGGEEGLRAYGLPSDLNPYFVLNSPRNIAKADRMGYIPLDEVSTSIGESTGGDFKHPETGGEVRVMVCLAAVREKRLKRTEERNQRINEGLYAGDKELPISGVRRTAPAGYEVTN